MTAYFTSQHYSKSRHDPFTPPSPPLSTSTGTPASSTRNPNPFDPNLYISSPSATPGSFADSYRKESNTVDFSEELAQLMKSSSNNNASPAIPSSYDDYTRHPPHNIFDVSAHPAAAHHFPSHFSIPVPSSSQFRPGSSSHHHHGPDSPFATNSPFSPHSEGTGGAFAHHLPLPSPLPPLNINGHHPPPPPPEETLSPQSPFDHHPTPILDLHHHHHHHAPRRPISPVEDSRSRSRSKPPPLSSGGTTNGGGATSSRSRMSKKRASMSGIERPHPSAIMIPSNGSRPNTSSGSAPLSAHAMGWPAFSLPTPDSLSTHTFGGFGGASPKNVLSQNRKEESPDLDPSSKQAIIANEKRRRRRESHNAVERRRRDNINEKISELATLIPECMLDPSMTTGASGGNGKEVGIEVFASVNNQLGDDGDSKDTPAIKANKGMILRKSVDYIRYLQQLVTAQASRNRDLEAQVQQLQSNNGIQSSPSISSPHSTDSTSDINNHNFHVFGDDLLNGINGMGMVDILHSLAPEDSDSYLSMQFGGSVKSTTSPNHTHAHSQLQLETLHEHAHADHPEQRNRDFEADSTGGGGAGEAEADMELDDTSPSAASADSPEDRGMGDPEIEKEEAQRGRARVRTRSKPDEAEHEVKKESPMDV